MKKRHYILTLTILITIFYAINLSWRKDRSPAANISEVPILGFFTEGANALIKSIYSASSKTLKVTKDLTLFTVGGVALDVYIRTQLPLDNDVRNNILLNLHNYNYASRLTYFLTGLKDRYELNESIQDFEKFIKSNYKSTEEAGLIHSLFQWAPSEDKEEESGGIDKKLIAKLLTIYSIIFSKESSYISNELPDFYTRLGKSKEDQAVINEALPIIIELLSDFTKDMSPGDMKDMMTHIISDGAPKNLSKKNNKAIAATTTLIDFVKMSVLKNYRIHVKQSSRIQDLTKWMKKSFKDELKNKEDGLLIDYLRHQNEKRKFAVQYVVDGLQGNLIESLALRKKHFLKRLLDDENNKTKFKPHGYLVESPKQVIQLDFLKKILSKDFKEDERYLPFFKKIYNESINTIFKNGVSTTPTISVRNLPIVKTGANVSGPGGTNIPNFHFVDRNKDRAYYFFGNDALLLDEIVAEQKMKSMFDRLQHYKTMNCNAQYDWNAHFTLEPLVNLGLGESVRDFGEALCFQELKKRSQNEVSIRSLRSKLIRKIKNLKQMSSVRRFAAQSQKVVVQKLISKIARLEEHTLPTYLLVYNPWPDHFAHFKGAFSDEIISPSGELNRLDYWLGQFETVYKDAKVYDRTLFAMAGDHGLAPIYYTLNPEIVVLKKLEEETGRKIIIEKISSDEGEGPKLTNPLDPPTNKAIDVIVASTAGGNYMMDFFKDQKERWEEQPTYADLTKWIPLSGGKPIDMISEILNRLTVTLDYIVVRDSSSLKGATATRIIGTRNKKRYDELIIKYKKKIFYKGIQHDIKDLSLLEISKTNSFVSDYTKEDFIERDSLISKCVEIPQESEPSTWCSQSEWRLLTRTTPNQDSINQLAYLYESDRAGTVNLFPADGIGFNTSVPGRHAGESFHEKDAFVGFWGTPAQKNTRLKIGINGSIAPTLYEYITGDLAIQDIDGWGFNSHWKEIEKKEAGH